MQLFCVSEPMDPLLMFGLLHIFFWPHHLDNQSLEGKQAYSTFLVITLNIIVRILWAGDR